MPPGYDRFESFGHDDVDGIKILEKDDQAAKHCFFISMFCSLVIFIKNFDPIDIRRP